MLEYNEFEYKKTNNHCKLEERFQKNAIIQSHICKFADKKTAYNEGHLYLGSLFSNKNLKNALATQVIAIFCA